MVVLFYSCLLGVIFGGDKRSFTPGLAFKFECTAKIAEGAEMRSL